MPALVQLVYLSSAVELFEPEQIKALMAQSVANNTALGITGILLYKDGNFLQAIEGEEPAIDGLFAKIAADPRHKTITKLLKAKIVDREFSNWAMAFKDLASPEIRNNPAYSDYLQTELVASEFSQQPSKAKTLLKTFSRAFR